MKKNLIAIVVIFAMIAAMAGCSSKESEYPVLEDAKEPAAAEEASFNGFTGSYDTDKWVFDNSMGNFAIYDKAIYMAGNPDGQCPNVNANISQDFEGRLTEDDMNSLMDELKNMGIDGFTVVKNEMRTFNGEPVIYYETKTEITDDMIDLLIENGNMTEADIDAMGGRDRLKEVGETDSIGIAAVIDGKIVIVTGTYYDDSADVLEAMKLLLKTGKVS